MVSPAPPEYRNAAGAGKQVSPNSAFSAENKFDFLNYPGHTKNESKSEG
jgi:hypothetical protein